MLFRSALTLLDVVSGRQPEEMKALVTPELRLRETCAPPRS